MRGAKRAEQQRKDRVFSCDRQSAPCLKPDPVPVKFSAAAMAAPVGIYYRQCAGSRCAVPLKLTVIVQVPPAATVLPEHVSAPLLNLLAPNPLPPVTVAVPNT